MRRGPQGRAVTEAADDLEPVAFDSMGSPIFAHQLPPEDTSDER